MMKKNYKCIHYNTCTYIINEINNILLLLHWLHRTQQPLSSYMCSMDAEKVNTMYMYVDKHDLWMKCVLMRLCLHHKQKTMFSADYKFTFTDIHSTDLHILHTKQTLSIWKSDNLSLPQIFQKTILTDIRFHLAILQSEHFKKRNFK